jgi:hypothetical protein
MIDRELPTRAHQARREPQIPAANGLLGRPGCRRLASSGEPTDDRPSGAVIWGIPGNVTEPATVRWCIAALRIMRAVERGVMR